MLRPDERKKYYKCKYCGHKQAELFGNGLCPKCGHWLVLVVKKRHGSTVGKIMAIVFALSVLAGVYSYKGVKLPFWNIGSSERDWQSSGENTGDPLSGYEFANIESDILESKTDLHTYYRISGEVRCTRFGITKTQMSLYIQKNNLTIYSVSDNLGMLIPYKAYPFSFEVDYSELIAVGLSPTEAVSSIIEAKGVTIR